MSEQSVEIADPEGLLKAYNKAKEDLVTLRAELKSAKDELSNISDEAVTKWKQIAVQSQALSELQAQGVKDGKRIISRLDLSDVEYDDQTGTVKGLTEKLDAFKADFPELFDTKKRAGKQSADIHADSPVAKKLTGTEAQVARLFNQ